MFNNMPTWLKAIFALIGSILIGGIGSGVWEKILSPLFNFISNSITTILSFLSSTYSDSLYQSATHVYKTNNPSLLLIYIISILFFIYALNSKKDNNFINGLVKASKIYIQGWTGVVFAGSLLILSIFFVTRYDAINTIRSYSQQQMEVLRPYIGEEKYLRLRSDYLQIQNKHDFEKFLLNLYKDSESANIKINKFTQTSFFPPLHSSK